MEQSPVWFNTLPEHLQLYPAARSPADARAQARGLVLAQFICDGVPDEVLAGVVQRLLSGKVPLTLGQALMAEELRREGLLP